MLTNSIVQWQKISSKSKFHILMSNLLSEIAFVVRFNARIRIQTMACERLERSFKSVVALAYNNY